MDRRRSFAKQLRLPKAARIALEYALALGIALLASYGILHIRW